MSEQNFIQFISQYPEPLVFAVIGFGIFFADIVFELLISPLVKYITE